MAIFLFDRPEQAVGFVEIAIIWPAGPERHLLKIIKFNCLGPFYDRDQITRSFTNSNMIIAAI